MKIKSGDKVKVLVGKDQGKTGKVIQVLKNKKTSQYYVVVEGINKLKKHMKPGKSGEKGQVIELSAPIHISNVMLIDEKSNKATRIGYKKEGNDKKRIAKINGGFIE